MHCYPEFQEYFVHYPIKTSTHSSHEFAKRAVGRDQQVLDLGCGEGFFAEKLQQMGNHVTGIDALPSAARRPFFDKYIQADLENGFDMARAELRGKTFDKVLLMDVLEHLREPERLLRECQGLLKPTGRLIVSVPNVANITVRVMLLFGQFRHAERGILDKTHLHFFTRRTARKMLESNGYRVVTQKMTIIPLEFVLRLRPEHLLIRILQRLLIFCTALAPGLLGYQTFFIAQRDELTGSK
jgi:2-polyprenyl-3-methyl-5-hydroxy-6-metoxy-1,4-benzoquinol methylase